MLISLGELQKTYHLDIRGILHVGAHTCEERGAYKRVGISDDDVLWVEGNMDLVCRVRREQPEVKIFHALVGDTDYKEVDFIVTNNFQSSSILELQEHKKEHPEVVETGRKRQFTMRLDTLISHKLLPFVGKKHNFLNLDIQGAELLALRGLGRYLDDIDYVYTEVNTKHLYRGCALLAELDSFLSGRGFVRREINMTEHGWGDAFYTRAAK